MNTINDDHDRDREPIQGPRYTEGLNNATTELVRVVAENKRWEVDLDDAVWAGDLRIAGSIVGLAERAEAAGWFTRAPHGDRWSGIAWAVVPNGSEAAARALVEIASP